MKGERRSFEISLAASWVRAHGRVIYTPLDLSVLICKVGKI